MVTNNVTVYQFEVGLDEVFAKHTFIILLGIKIVGKHHCPKANIQMLYEIFCQHRIDIMLSNFA